MNIDSGFQQCQARDSKNVPTCLAPSLDKENCNSVSPAQLPSSNQSAKPLGERVVQQRTCSENQGKKSSDSPLKQSACQNQSQHQQVAQLKSENSASLKKTEQQQQPLPCKENQEPQQTTGQQQALTENQNVKTSQSNAIADKMSEFMNNTAPTGSHLPKYENQNTSDTTELDSQSKREGTVSEASNFNDVSVGDVERQQKDKNDGVQDTTQTEIVNVSDVIYMDTHHLNFTTTLPGKMLGSTLLVGNQTDSEQVVELAVDTTSFQFSRHKIVEEFKDVVDFDEDLPFPILQKDLQNQENENNLSIANSEKKHECWWIENPVSRELTKRITIKLGAQAEQEFIIVFKAPQGGLRKNMTDMVSKMSLSLLSYADEGFGVRQSFEQFLKTQFRGSMKEFLRDRKKLGQKQRTQILLASRVEIPRLTCMKALRYNDIGLELASQTHMIPILVKNDGGLYRFRIPFKYQGTQDIKLEFLFPQNFEETSNDGQEPSQGALAPNGQPQSLRSKINPALNKSNSADQESKKQSSPPITLCAQPNIVAVNANQTTPIQLNLTAKYNKPICELMQQFTQEDTGLNKDLGSSPLKKSKSANLQSKATANQQKHYLLMVARVQETNIMYSFYIEATITDAFGNAAEQTVKEN